MRGGRLVGRGCDGAQAIAQHLRGAAHRVCQRDVHGARSHRFVDARRDGIHDQRVAELLRHPRVCTRHVAPQRALGVLLLVFETRPEVRGAAALVCREGILLRGEPRELHLEVPC